MLYERFIYKLLNEQLICIFEFYSLCEKSILDISYDSKQMLVKVSQYGWCINIRH